MSDIIEAKDAEQTSEQTPFALPPSCSAWIDPEQDKPEWTGKYLVWTSDGPDILRIEEGFMEYSDGEPADWDEISAWAEVRKPNAGGDLPPPSTPESKKDAPGG